MKIKSKVKSNKEKGFTMVEILAVITLVGFLMVLIVPNVIKNVNEARKKTTKSQVAAIENLVVQYYMDCGSYPTNEQGLKALIQKPSTAPDGWNGPYTKSNTKFTDSWNKDLKYVYPGTHNPDSYDLYSFGPNMQEGGDDDIGNW